MKRTLTAAAAVVASSAGAVGFAGTAAAVEAPGFPKDVPMDGYATAMSVRPVEQSAPTGAVTPMDQQKFTGKNAESTGGGPVGGLLAGSPLGSLAGGGASPLGGAGKSTAPDDLLHGLPIGDVIPHGENLPARARAGDPLSGLLGGTPLGKLLGGSPGVTQGNPQQQKPASGQQKPSGAQEQKPTSSSALQPANIQEQMPDSSAGRPTGGDPLTGVTGGRPSGRIDQSSATSPLNGPVGEVISQSPLGGMSTLSG